MTSTTDNGQGLGKGMAVGASRGAPRYALRNANLFDSRAARFLPHSTLVVAEGRIDAATQEAVDLGDLPVVDVGGRAVLPGLIDAHVHVTATSHDLFAVLLQPPSLVGAESARIMREMLHRGFTTVRDCGGADQGLQEAQRRGLYEGPRLYIAGHPVSQTGGHADMRPKGVRGPGLMCACAGLGLMGAIADGVGEVRRAVREQVRTGANQIKIMAGGGVASPSDPLEGTQFSVDELTAAVEEAEAANVYALAHAYSPRAVSRAVRAGVRSIEHGNLIDVATARLMKAQGAYLVPTLSTYAALADEGARLGWSEEMLAKLAAVQARGLQSLEIARAEGVAMAFGTDLLGHMHARQSGEFALRQQVQPAEEILRDATWTAATLMRQEQHLGHLNRGAWADLLVLNGPPAQALALLSQPDAGIAWLVQGGRTVRERLAAAAA